jgi:peroxiredoxin
MMKNLSTLKTIIPALALVVGLAAGASAQQDLTFVSPDGQRVALSGLRGKVVVLMFGGVQDPQCRDEFKALESLSQRYRGKDVSIYWVSVNSPSEATDERLKNPCGPAGSVMVLRDQRQAGFRQFGCKQLPTIVVLDKAGQLHGQPRGGFNPNSDFVNDLAAVIDNLLKQ